MLQLDPVPADLCYQLPPQPQVIANSANNRERPNVSITTTIRNQKLTAAATIIVVEVRLALESKVC